MKQDMIVILDLGSTENKVTAPEKSKLDQNREYH